jgi:hypothetical protein
LLPAVLTTAEVALASPGSALRTFATLRRPRLVDYERPAHQRAPIACLHCLIGKRIVVNLDKAKSSGFTAKPIAQYVYAIYFYTGFRKESLYVRFRGFVGQIPHEQLCHLNSLLTVVRNSYFDC